MLTKYLLETSWKLFCIEIDQESIDYLKHHYSSLKDNLIVGDFIKMNISELTETKIGMIGNFPYNISSQIMFKALDHKDQITEIVGMFQKEVGKRLASPPGSKEYGILSVLLQAFYKVEYLFDVPPSVFYPPPKVHSAVLRLQRNNTVKLNCDEKFFKIIVKQGFQTRRKKLRNALKPLNLPEEIRTYEMLDLRAEQLSVGDFINLTAKLQSLGWPNPI
jgi:16S rRNA (adenine1518-N6/adenine1519-N6)-dimethyltransferase